MKKTLCTHYDEAMMISEMMTEFDDISCQAIICTAIDTLAAVTGEDPNAITDRICTAVRDVNRECGAYNPF